MQLGEVQASGEKLHDVSVAAVLLRDFGRQAVSEQARLKARLEEAVAAAASTVPAAERIVLDAGEGFAIIVLDDPQAALDIAQRAQAPVADLSPCVGLNYGPVKMGGHADILGDGLLAALTVAKLATRGRVLASRSFRDALERRAPHRAAALAPVGAFSDASLRKHELFALEPGAARARERRLLLVFGLCAAGIIGAGFGIRALRSSARQPAVIAFDITPQGQIYIDGELKGVSPPLKRLDVPPGEHVVEVRNSPHPPLRLKIAVKPGQEMTLAHSFQAPRKGQRGAGEESFIEQLRRKWGN